MKYGTFTVEVEIAPGETRWVRRQGSGALEVTQRSTLAGDGKLAQTPRRTPS